MGEAVTLVPNAPVEIKIDGNLVNGRMFGMAVRDIKGKAVLVEVVLWGGRSTLVPWRDVSTTDDVGLYLLGPEVTDQKKKKTEKT
jgi:hypothetical protein